MVKRALVAVGAAALLVVLVALATRPSASTPALPREPIAAAASVSPRAVLFGDTLHARVDVLLDRRRVDPRSVHVVGGFSPYQADLLGTARHDQGRATRLSWVFRLTCLSQTCLPTDPIRGGRSEVALTPPRVVFRSTAGRRGDALLELPPLEVASRLTPEEAAIVGTTLPPPMRVDASPPRTTYALSPTLLETLLFVLAALLLGAGAWLVLRALPRLRLREPRAPTALERALAVLQRTLDEGVVPEQRKALELLATELGRTGEEQLASSARVLAWARPSPRAAGAERLADDVRSSVVEGTNGRPH